MKNPVLSRRVAQAVVPAGKQRGAALLEVLIAFFILAIGLMGLVGMQMKSLQFNQGAYQRSQATMAVYDILDRMRLNRKAAQGDEYEIDWSSSASGSSVAKKDLAAWLHFVNGNLPSGEGKIDCDSDDVCTVSVRWTDRFTGKDGDKEELAISSQM